MSFPKARSSVDEVESRNIGGGDGGEDNDDVMNLIIVVVVTLICGGGGGGCGVVGVGGETFQDVSGELRVVFAFQQQ